MFSIHIPSGRVQYRRSVIKRLQIEALPYVTLVLGLMTPQDAGAGTSMDVTHTTEDDSYMMSIDNQVSPACVSSSWHCGTKDASMPYRPPACHVAYAGVGECNHIACD